MGINRYLQRVIQHSTSPAVKSVAKKIHGVAAFGDRVLGVSAARTAAQAKTAKKLATSTFSQHTNRFSAKVNSRALKEKKLSNHARVATAAVLGVGHVVKKALQPPEDDVYYSSY